MNLSDALIIFSDQLPDIRKACIENARAVSSLPHKELDVDAIWTKEDISLHISYLEVTEKTKSLMSVINRIDSKKKSYSKESITDEDIEQAKEILLVELYDGKLFGRTRKYGLCPFHNEQSPSFYIFPNNKFHCFGCQAHGTPIDYIMLRDGVNFITAVKFLRGTI